jgi:MFS transporter, OPA family, sugar phosphate sensor protein UhpC
VGLLSFLKPSPYIPVEQDKAKVDSNYRYWRIRTFYSMYIGYVFYYFTRKSFTFAMPSMIEDLGLQKSDLGILASILSLTYGISKFLSGILADRTNPRYIMSIGLIITGIVNIFFGFSSSLLLFAFFIGFNGLFQGWGWPPCARLLTHWYSQKERGRWWGFWNTSHSVGGFIIPILAAFCAQYFGWRSAMHVPGILCIIVGFFLLNRLRDTPRSLGLPPIEEYKNDYVVAKQDDREVLSLKQILVDHVLKNKFLWILGIAYFFIYVIRTAVSDWTMFYFIEEKGYSKTTSGFLVSFFEIGGIFGSLAAGWVSDKVFAGNRGPANVLWSVGIVGAIALFAISTPAFLGFDIALMSLIGFLIFGPQMLIGMAAAELSDKRAAGSANGFVNCLAYLGATCAGYPFGKITQEWGWKGFYLALGICSVVALCCLLPLWATRTYRAPVPTPEKKEEEVPVAVAAEKVEADT